MVEFQSTADSWVMHAQLVVFVGGKPVRDLILISHSDVSSGVGEKSVHLN